MPKRDHYDISVTNTGNDVDMGQGRPWQGPGSVIYSIQIVAPAAATGFNWSLGDGADVPFNGVEPTGTTVSYDTNAFSPVNLMAERGWNLTGRHTGAAAQDITVVVEWD